MNIEEVALLISKFVERKNTSIDLAKKIEVALDELFPDNEYVQDTVTILAMYRPGGGDFLFDEQIVINRLKKVIKILRPD